MGSLRHPRAFCIGQSGGLGPKKGLRPQGRGQRVEGTEVGIEWGVLGEAVGLGGHCGARGQCPGVRGQYWVTKGQCPGAARGWCLGAKPCARWPGVHAGGPGVSELVPRGQE